MVAVSISLRAVANEGVVDWLIRSPARFSARGFQHRVAGVKRIRRTRGCLTQMPALHGAHVFAGTARRLRRRLNE